ncbi:heterokaryon incompatibility protein-domain-containing protein [Xylaria telfairii]|nr:heterokaryon incompatibility protein-domain-containing protein [Xylaria telfairii]
MVNLPAPLTTGRTRKETANSFESMTHEQKVCDFCVTNILQSRKPSGDHHADHEGLGLSASQRCPFCLVLNEDINGNKSTRFNSRFKDPIYRWTIRPAGKIRESQAYVILTFRPILPDLGNLPSPAGLGSSTNSPRSQQRVKAWVENCVKKHPKCNLRESGRDFIPTRLVDLGEPGAEWAAKSVRIVHTKESGIRAHYVTLSHRWGETAFFNLKKTLEKSAVLEVPIEDINNKNFTQAMVVARYLGVRYIWIDSLCIVQDDEADWFRESQLMHQVYRNSYCNFAAVDSGDGDGGLFRERQNIVDQLVPTRYDPSREVSTQKSALFGDRLWRVLSGGLWQDEVLGRTLYTRAWVFQERLLSPRILHFSRNQIFWDCATLSACETMPDEIPIVLQNQAATDRHWRERLQDTALMIPPISGTANHSLEAFWSLAVLSYTSCNITKQSDKLKALWGIAKLVRDALSEEYVAGLWEPELHQQLGWRVVDWEKSVRTKDLDLGYPSWSWSSVSGAIEVANRMTGYSYYKITDHDGQPLFPKVKNRVYARHIESGFSDWNDEIRFMTAELAKRQAKIVSEIQKAGSNAEPMPRSQPEAALIYKAENSYANMMPELENTTLEIQGHISRGRMVMSSEDKDCWIIVQEPSGSAVTIEAFPDERPEAEETECLFVILSAGRDDYDSTYYYSGNGISE